MNNHNHLLGSITPNSSAEFQFIPSSDPKVLKIVFRGFWNDDVLERYREALRQRALAAGGITPVNRVLLDLRACVIQSQTVIRGMAQIIETYAAQVEHYAMMLQTSPLLRAQMMRLMIATPVCYLNSEEEATTWISG